MRLRLKGTLYVTRLVVGLWFFWGLAAGLSAQNEGIDVVHYDVRLGDFSFKDESFKGHTTVEFLVSIPTDSLILELFQLSPDSVVWEGKKLMFDYASPKLMLRFPELLRSRGSYKVEVYYNGKPSKDPAGFGGFFFRDNVAFNIGVTMNIFPHNGGKLWFPCVDNFTDKAVYDFYVTAPARMTAVCGGELLSSETDTVSGQTRYHWALTDPIPTYLASVAVGNYEVVRDTFEGLKGKVPISIYAQPGTETLVRGSFINLKKTIGLFESLFGPYVWQRVGYVAVPFYAGAMEHATNIAYPDAVINGGLQFETLWAHELSHSWFGNLITCKNAGDMWLNEGFARYCEALFLEYTYGRKNSQDYLRKLQIKTLKNAHYTDGGFFPVYDVPKEITYGKTVYDKGALVAHGLRNQIGDTAFYNGFKQYFRDLPFGNQSSFDLRDRMTIYSGKDLTGYFDEQVFENGFSHFRIQSFETQMAAGGFNTTVKIKQSGTARNRLLVNHPTEFLLISENGDSSFVNVIINNNDDVSVASDFRPKYIFTDPDERFTDATADAFIELRRAGLESDLRDPFDIKLVTDNPNRTPCSIRVSRHFVTPETKPVSGLKWANHYWSFEPSYCQAPVTKMDITFFYNGDTANGTDKVWIEAEDSIALFYRPNPTSAWQRITDKIERSTGGSKTDLRGDVYVFDAPFGDYAFGSVNGFTDRKLILTQKPKIELYPNPAEDRFFIAFTEKLTENTFAEIVNLIGQTVKKTVLNRSGEAIFVGDLPAGLYAVRITDTEKGVIFQGKIAVK